MNWLPFIHGCCWAMIVLWTYCFIVACVHNMKHFTTMKIHGWMYPAVIAAVIALFTL